MSPHYGKFVAYFRVSTDRQGKSGLGLDAQREAVMNYLNGGRWSLVDEFTEVESGKRNDRPELEKALAACKKLKARLVIAKLDRLSRNLAFIAALMDSGVEFVAVDNPHANKLTVHILAAVAQHERESISAPTSAALKAAQARGKRLGNPRLSHARRLAAAARKEGASRFSANVLPVIREIQGSGIKSLRGVARALTARGIPTVRGGSCCASPSHRRATKQRDELAPPNHSITSLARASSTGEISRPIDLTVFRLIRNSNLVGCVPHAPAHLVGRSVEHPGSGIVRSRGGTRGTSARHRCSGNDRLR